MTDNPRSLWLVPASPDTAWWQALTQKASWISFPRGRIRFEGPGPKGSPRFASAYVGFGLHVPRDPIFGRAWSPL